MQHTSSHLDSLLAVLYNRWSLVRLFVTGLLRSAEMEANELDSKKGETIAFRLSLADFS